MTFGEHRPRGMMGLPKGRLLLQSLQRLPPVNSHSKGTLSVSNPRLSMFSPRHAMATRHEQLSGS